MNEPAYREDPLLRAARAAAALGDTAWGGVAQQRVAEAIREMTAGFVPQRPRCTCPPDQDYSENCPVHPTAHWRLGVMSTEELKQIR